MKSKIAWVVAGLTLMVGTATADLMTPTRSSIDPTTPPPIGPEVPLIMGTIVSVDEQNVVVDTHDGSTVSFMIDSRTMMPSNMAAGLPVKVQFKVLDSGSYMAQRFTPVIGEEGRELAARHWDLYSTDRYATDMDREDTGTSTYDRDRDASSGADVDRDASRTDRTENSGELAQVTTDNDANNNGIDDSQESNVNSDDADRLPQTASTGSWIAVLGVISLAAAGGLSFARRRRSA
jgi:LPXTG-motif cell wall-anchored protein